MFNMNVSPLVSIILPTYNRAAFILETIESIRNQTFKNWELIIVDDGSDDNTEEIICQLKDERIQFIKAGRTESKGKLINTGIQKASGGLYAFIDSDDIWAPEKIEKQVRALQQYPEAEFCLTGGFNFYTAYEPEEYFYKKREGIKVGNIFTDYFRSELAGFTQALMLRKDCMAVIGLFEEKKSFGDLDFILSLAYHFTAIILYEPLFYRRLHKNSYINTTWEKSYFESIEIINSYRNKKMVEPKLARQSLYNLYINFGEDCLTHKKRKKAITHFFNAWKNKPLSIVPFKKSGKALLYHVKNK